MSFYKVVAAPSWDFSLVPTIPAGQDWSALYFQLTPEQALGYATDKDSPEHIISLVKFSWKQPIPIHRLDCAEFGQPDIAASIKAELVRRELNITTPGPLMQHLNAALVLRETATDYELIIPHHLLTPQTIQAETLYQFRVNPVAHTLVGFRQYGEINWRQMSLAEQLDPVKLCPRLTC